MDLTQVYSSLPADLVASLPLVLVALGGIAVIVFDAFRNRHPAIPVVTGLILAVGLVLEATKLGGLPEPVFFEMIRVGGVASFVNVLILGSALLTVVLSRPYLKSIGYDLGEAYGMILFATFGAMILGTANNLVALFVGLETMSIPLYIMVALPRERVGAIESALKYFMLGAFATGFFLYGIALLYGATGTMSLTGIRDAVAGGSSVMFWAGVALLMVGVFFKVSAVPFHMWTPDAYQGAPTTVTGFMSTASKTAAFAALIMVLYLAVPPERYTGVIAFFAVLTMVVGNVLALSQSNVKRLLAYSSIAHAGYIMVALTAASPDGYSGALFYLLVYTFMNIGAFGVISLLEWDNLEGSEQTLDSLAGIGYRKPLLGWLMVIFMFSLTGFPPLGGFLGKWAVFAPAIRAGYTWLAIVGVLASAVSAFYYLRVLVVLFMKPEEETSPAARAAFPVSRGSAAVLIVCAALLVVLGVTTFALDLTDSFFVSAIAAG